MSKNEQSRMAFEKWAEEKNRHIVNGNKYRFDHDNNGYVCERTAHAFAGWQASEQRLIDMLLSEEVIESAAIAACCWLNGMKRKKTPEEVWSSLSEILR